jgi:cell division septation protein DedD
MQGQETSKIRNLDELQESDAAPPRGSRLGALVLASLGGTCLIIASAVLLRQPSSGSETSNDPLGALVEKAKTEPQEGLDVTFPKLLGGADRQTTALEAVRDPKRAPEDAEFQLPPGHPTEPPPAADKLPVIPLPAQHILAAAGKETAPHGDVLTSMARVASRENGTEVEAGGPGGFQLQVSSFDQAVDAEAFAAVLRRRGHKAYVEAANVKGRGVWHRVRIGPFKYKRSAEIYRQEFEAKERLVTFIVSPPKTKVRVAQATDAEE